VASRNTPRIRPDAPLQNRIDERMGVAPNASSGRDQGTISTGSRGRVRA
jgi:hypothetical protein